MRPFCSCRQRPASLYNVLIVVGFTIIAIVFGAKAGLEHRNYPYDLKRLKLNMVGNIPSLIPSVPIADNRTVIKYDLTTYAST